MTEHETLEVISCYVTWRAVRQEANEISSHGWLACLRPGNVLLSSWEMRSEALRMVCISADFQQVLAKKSTSTCLLLSQQDNEESMRMTISSRSAVCRKRMDRKSRSCIICKGRTQVSMAPLASMRELHRLAIRRSLLSMAVNYPHHAGELENDFDTYSSAGFDMPVSAISSADGMRSEMEDRT